jgi:site-specific recombinase XerD
MMGSSREANVIPLIKPNAVILRFVDGSVARHTQWMRLRGLSADTIEDRGSVLGLLTRHAAKPLRDLTAADLDGWQRSLGILSANTRKTYVSHVRAYYQWATVNDGVDGDPASVLIVPKVPRGLPRPIGEAPLQVALARATLRMRCWLELAAYDGLRAAEIARLERPDVLDTGPLRMLVIHGKGGRMRVIPLSDTPLASLYELGMPAHGALFRKRNGFPVTPHYVSKTANDYLHGIGIVETLHQLRHRFGTQALNVSGNLRQVQDLMGHASPSTTAIYTLINPKDAAPTIAAIDHPLLRPVQDAS